MRQRKPDLLFLLSTFLIIGVIASSFGPELLKSLDAQAKPTTFARVLE